MYYPCSENIGADQLRGYREADLRLFSPMQIVGFPMRRLIYLLNFDSSSTVMLQDLLGKNVVWNIYDDLLHSHLTQECGFAYADCWFSHEAAHLSFEL